MSDGGAVGFPGLRLYEPGGREGYTGVSYYRYEAESNTLTEQFFLPAAEPYSELRLDLARLAHKGQNGIFYMYMGGSVYGIDLNSHEYVVVASGLDEERFAVSSDGSRLAWQEDTGSYDSRMLHIMDLDTGDKTQIGGPERAMRTGSWALWEATACTGSENMGIISYPTGAPWAYI